MLLLAFALFYFTISDLLKCFLRVLCNHQYSLGTAVAASHVLPTQCMIVMSCVRPAYAFVTSWKIIICHALFSFILVYFRCAHLK